MKLPTRLLLLFFCSLLSACSTSSPTPSEPLDVTELSLFLTRRSLSGTEFEQYKLASNGKIFVECGKITGGRYAPVFQRLASLEEAQKAEMESALSKMIASTNYQKKSFDDPGNNSSLFDPGKYEISFTTNGDISGKVSTSLDSVTEHNNPAEKELFNIAKAIRTGVSFYEPICDNRDFYGLPGKRYPRS